IHIGDVSKQNLTSFLRNLWMLSVAPKTSNMHFEILGSEAGTDPPFQ
ncbi:hypothetical protein Tco_0757271, partial [Tanacetum coccineum]